MEKVRCGPERARTVAVKLEICKNAII